MTAAATVGCAAPERASTPRPPAHVVDLTHTLAPRFPFIPVQNKTFPFRIAPIATLEHDGVYANRWELTEHVGTHLDAPSHFTAGADSIERIGLESLIAPLAVISIAERAKREPDTRVEVADLDAWEKLHGPLPEGAALFVHTGWEARVATRGAFVNADGAGTMHFPGFSTALVEHLLTRRRIRGIGIDTLSIDPGDDVAYPVHKRLFGAGKWAVECVANLAQVPPRGATVIVAPVKVEGASGAPARVFAHWD